MNLTASIARFPGIFTTGALIKSEHIRCHLMRQVTMALRGRVLGEFIATALCAMYILPIDQLHVLGIYHFLKAQNFPEFLIYVI